MHLLNHFLDGGIYFERRYRRNRKTNWPNKKLAENHYVVPYGNYSNVGIRYYRLTLPLRQHLAHFFRVPDPWALKIVL
mgnify:CR=1 FL=1